MPVGRKGEATTHDANGNDGTTSRARVLLADDHRAMLDRISTLLASDFAIVGAVLDGDELVEAAAALQPDVLVVDISMPRMSGLEAAARIRLAGSDVPIVCLTAHEEPDYLQAAVAAGVLGYVTKTSLARDLIAAVRAALEGRSFISASMGFDHPLSGTSESM
jgi:DNA-binding NarL/FixJ family response regulator